MHKRTLIALLGVTVVSAGVASLASAHHGWSGYDASQVVRVTGVIREAGYEHPHGHVRLEAEGKTWLVVLAPPSRMERRGLTQAMLGVGSTATVVGYPNRNDPGEVRAERITVGDKSVELR